MTTNIEWHKKKWMEVASHVAVWLIIFLLPYIFNAGYDAAPHKEVSNKADFRGLITVTNIFWVALFYFNAIILTPHLIYRRKFVAYFLSLLILFTVIMLLHGIIFPLLTVGRTFNFFRSSAYNIFAFLFTIAISVTYKTVLDKIKSDKLMTEKQNEHLKTELSFLRSQISPHFLFNVMNNIVALVRLKSEELEPTVMKLSALMQYMLYETDEEKVLLKSEAEYLQSYIDLQKQRFGPELTVNASFDAKEDWHAIEPMLLIPFVENAFKHGTGLLQNPEIDVHLSVLNNHLNFLVKNKYEERTAIKDKTSGIGLANVIRRLELLYPDKHTITIHKKEDWFTVDLHLTLK